MNFCEKCLENNWDFKYNDGFIMATCQNCGHEVEFEAKKKPYKKPAYGQICKCGKATLCKKKLKFKQSKLKKSYYYTDCFFCPACKKLFYSDKFKIWNSAKNNTN